MTESGALLALLLRERGQLGLGLEDALEAGKILGIVLLWLISYVCGKKKLAEPQQEPPA